MGGHRHALINLPCQEIVCAGASDVQSCWIGKDTVLIDERVAVEEHLSFLDLMHRGTAGYLEGQRTMDSLRKAEIGH
jgi:hypothetical protein